MLFGILKPDGMKEVVYNMDQITKIEVHYSVPGEDKEGNPTSDRKDIASAWEDPDATRWYKVFIGGDSVVKANPDDPIRATVEQIRREALRG